MKKNFKIKKTLLGLICFFSLFAVATVEDSGSFFSKTQVVTENSITAGYWQQKPKAGDVIINEVNWAGSPASKNNKDHDQWIELYNTTDRDIPLKGWTIENASITPKDFKITGNPIIRAGEYLLITRRKDNSAESALNVPSDVQNASLYLNRADYKQLILKDTDGVEIDKTPVVNSPWPEGEYIEEERYFSMQRMNNTNKTGEEKTSWYTCDPDNFGDDDELSLMYDYWKEEYRDYVCGTPRNPNLPSDDSDEGNNSLSIPESHQSIQPLNVEEENKKEDEENGDSARATSVQTDSQSSDLSSEINEDDDSDTDTDSDDDNEIEEDKEKLNDEDQDKDDSEDNTADDPSESEEDKEVINNSEQEEVIENADDKEDSEGTEEKDTSDDSDEEEVVEESDGEQENTEEEDSDKNSDNDPSESPEDSTESSQGTEETESQTSDDNSGDSDEEQSN